MPVGLHERAVGELPELPRREPYRTWPGALIVLAIIVAYVSVWVVADNEISPDLEPVAAGSVQQVGPAITFVPRDGWYVDATDSSTSGSTATVTLVGQAGTFLIQVSGWQGTPAEEVDRQKSTTEVFGDARLIGDDATFSAAGGLSGTTFSFIKDETQGRMWVSVDETADRAVLVVGRALNSSFATALPSFEEMLDSIRAVPA